MENRLAINGTPLPAVVDDGAVFQGEDPPGLLGDVQVVGDQHQGYAQLPAGVFEQSEHLLARFTVKIARGLVCKEDRRLVGQSAGDGHPLLLPPGEGAGQVIEALAQAQHLHEHVDVFLLRFSPVQEHRQQDVLVGGELLHQVVGLENETEAAAAQDG